MTCPASSFLVLQNLFVELVHLLHFQLLVSPFDFFPLAFDVLYILNWFCQLISLFSQLFSVLLLVRELNFLIFVKPRNTLDINFMLRERPNVFP